MSENIPQVAIIGITGFGGTHLTALKKLEAAGLLKIAAATVINRPDAESKCSELEANGCRIYGDYLEMLNAERGRIDLCDIPTGIAWHSPMTIAALDAGFHVLVEKPAAGTPDEVDAMIEAQKRSGKRVFVGFQDLMMDTTVAVKQRLLEGKIGELKEIRIGGCWPRPDSYYQRNSWAGNIRAGDKLIYDSPANNAFSHYLMAALYFCANELHAAARVESFEAELYRAQPIESFDTISGRIQTIEGKSIIFTLTHSCQSMQGPLIDFHGTEGTIRWDSAKGFYLESGEFLSTLDSTQTRVEVFHKILEAIREGNPAGCSLDMAREHTRLINALHAHCEIRDIPSDFIVETQTDKGPLRAISGIEEAVQKSREESKLLSELNLPWTKLSVAHQGV